MPYVSVATQLSVGDSLRSPILIPFDALARSQLNPDDPLTRRLSSFLLPQPKRDLQCRRTMSYSPPCASLKPSLKGSRGRRVISGKTTPRTRSPAGRSPPPDPKCVRFKDKDGELESVCHFRASGRPSSISHPRSHSDTETETETDNNNNARAAHHQRTGGTTSFALADISQVPSPHTPPDSNVHLESLKLLHPARPPLLRGIVRVRNISFEKTVTVRYSTDGWTTVSEAQARYVGTSPTDAAWDLFAFTIPLETAAPAPRKLLLLAVRYAVPDAGEWWDNNGGADFRAVLAPVPGSATGFGVGGMGAAVARPRRANVPAARTYAHTTLAQSSLFAPPATSA